MKKSICLSSTKHISDHQILVALQCFIEHVIFNIIIATAIVEVSNVKIISK